MTKADVLDAFKELQVCTDYNINGKVGQEIPFQMDRQKPVPVLKSFAGWNVDTTAKKTFSELPESMKTYVSFINEYLGVNIHYISNGPGRDQLVTVE